VSPTVQAESALAGLRDLSGVVGSFLVSSQGAVLAQDLPAYFGSAAYDVGPRASRLRLAAEASGQDLECCRIAYGSHILTLKPVGEGLLTVLCASDVNGPALRMALNLVGRQLEKMKLTGQGSLPVQAPTKRPGNRGAGGTDASEGDRLSASPDEPGGGEGTPPVPAPAEESHTVEPGRASLGARAPEASSARATVKSRAVYYRGRRVR